MTKWRAGITLALTVIAPMTRADDLLYTIAIRAALVGSRVPYAAPGFSLSSEDKNTPDIPLPRFAGDQLPFQSDFLTTDVVPVSAFTPLVTGASTYLAQLRIPGVNPLARLYWSPQTLRLVDYGVANSPKAEVGFWCGIAFCKTSVFPPLVLALPSIRRSVYWKQVGIGTASNGEVTVNNGSSVQQAYSVTTGTSDTDTQTFAASLGFNGIGADILRFLTATFTATFSHAHTVSNQVTTSQTFTCNSQPGATAECALWVLHERYDFIGKDGHPGMTQYMRRHFQWWTTRLKIKPGVLLLSTSRSEPRGQLFGRETKV